MKTNKIKEQIILALKKNNPFTRKQYIIIGDILTGEFWQIKDSFRMKKIGKQDIEKAITYVEMFSCDLIPGFWKNYLLEDR